MIPIPRRSPEQPERNNQSPHQEYNPGVGHGMDTAKPMHAKTMTFWEHVAELRTRLLVSAVALIAGMVACFFFVEPAARFIMKPVGDMQFIYLSPPELFMSYVKLALLGGVVLASPVILFQIWLFVRPGLSGKERFSLVIGLFFGVIFSLAVLPSRFSSSFRLPSGFSCSTRMMQLRQCSHFLNT
jgi:sec-independent protein translocase protein TatC